jgi:hypothetical protein
MCAHRDRIWKICKNTEERDLEIRKLKNTLLKNEYPEKVIDLEINKFIKNRSKPIENSSIENSSTNSTIKFSIGLDLFLMNYI